MFIIFCIFVFSYEMNYLQTFFTFAVVALAIGSLDDTGSTDANTGVAVPVAVAVSITLHRGQRRTQRGGHQQQLHPAPALTPVTQVIDR